MEDTSTDDKDSEDVKEEEECCLCLQPVPLVTTPCQHSACQLCLERVLLSTSSSLNDDMGDEEAIESHIVASCPTRGRCPFCRRPICMFDLKSNTDQSHVYEQNINLEETPLNGLEFAETNVDNKTISFKDGRVEIAFYKNGLSGDSGDDDSKELMRSQPFEQYYYHAKSLTFSGVVDWTKGGGPWEGVDKWEVVLQFSSDFRYVQRGAIIKKCSNNEPVSTQNEFPLDGTWLGQFGNGTDFTNAHRLTVTCNKFSVGGRVFHICLGRSNNNGDSNNDNGENTPVHFYWPEDFGQGHRRYRQEVESGIDLTTHPSGPDVGSVVTWKVNDPNFHRIFWKRETKQTSIPPVQLESVGRHGTKLYAVGGTSQSQMPALKYHSESPWGNTFIQLYTVGLASYHFVSPTGEGEEGAYISYEHERCSAWPPLDNGSPVPYRVPFSNHSYDSETRTFRGKICWMELCGTTWQGNSEWDYEIAFDSEFACIINGGVDMNSIASSTYGESLNYCNAAIVEIIQAKINEEDPRSPSVMESTENDDDADTDADHPNMINGSNETESGNSETNNASEVTNNNNIRRVRRLIGELKSRLREEGASVRTLALISEAARGAINDGLNPIDYNGMTRSQ
mmetsp:Transcript_27354/g.41191  ORF Transcript_27354/g.41191 Transcript_27354/m.41191 type:complete len:623 (-) Transcript_27354:78-1946(-)